MNTYTNQTSQDVTPKSKPERSQRSLSGHMRRQPVTSAQLAYLSLLGFSGETPEDKFSASRLIQCMKDAQQANGGHKG